MKAGKSIALAMILIFGIVMQCEIFQINLGNFDTGEYLCMELSYESNPEKEAFLTDVERVSEAHGVHPFATRYQYNSEIDKVLYLYGDSYADQVIRREQGIADRLYRSLSAGNTRVEYRDFAELKEVSDQCLYTVSFIGDMEDIDAVYEELSASYEITEPAITGSNEYDMTYLIWITIDLVMLLMTILCIAVKKKEVTIRISMGQDPGRIVLKNIAGELALDLFLFFGVKAVCSLFISGEYMARTVFVIYCVGILLSCLAYVSYAFYDIRRAFSDVFVTNGVKHVIYGLKFIVSVGTMAVIITNISLVMQNRSSLGKTDFADTYRDYSYLEIVDRNPPSEDASVRWEEIYDISNQIYVENYETLQPVVSEMVMQEGNHGAKYVLVNEYGGAGLKDFMSGLTWDENADVIYFIPEEYDSEETKEEAECCLGNILTDTVGLKEQVVIYDDSRSFSYINRNLENNMTTIRNPVLVYAKFHGADVLDRIHIEETKNVMFRLTDVDIVKLKEEYLPPEKGYELIITRVKDRFQYYNNLLRQGISFCSSVAVFILFLQIILTVTVVIMEYRNNAMEAALKKVLGYSLPRRCAKILLFTVISNGLVTTAAVVVGMVLELYRPQAALAVGAVLLALEFGMEFSNILRMEKENTLKTLKGGCL